MEDAAKMMEESEEELGTHFVYQPLSYKSMRP
jgi:hypothetical protein